MVVSIVQRKGGSGKTTTAQALGAGLLRRKKKVLYVDLDSQANLTYALGVGNEDLTSLDVLMGTATASEAIVKTPNGDIIGASEALAAIDLKLTDTGKEYRLREALEDVKGKYDYIIIDTSAALNVATVNALTASDNAVIPVQADVFSLAGIGMLNDTIEQVRKYCNPSLKIAGILITRYNGRAILSRDMQANVNELAEALHTVVFKTPIRECVSIKEAQAVRINIFDYAPKSNAAADYAAFIEEYIKRSRL